jgi:hypothetical protein
VLHISMAGRKAMRKAFDNTSGVHGRAGYVGFGTASTLTEARRIWVFGSSILGLHFPVMPKSVGLIDELPAATCTKVFHLQLMYTGVQ